MFSELREKYKTFIFDDYSIKNEDECIKIKYSFIIEGLSNFTTEWIIKTSSKIEDIKEIEEMVFSLGMVELISYWKLTCSPIVKINVNYLNKEQIDWWKKLYYNGLGEFFYINNIQTDMDNFMKIEVKNNKEVKYIASQRNLKGSLIPIGGGKDSIVTLDLLKDDVINNNCYIINERDITVNTAIIAGFEKENIITANRKLDKKIIELNKQNFLNGHTPFSAIVAFSAVLVAYLKGNKYVVLSNEASANESTVLNEDINHQYSKSYEFEKDFNLYIEKYLKINIEYFSILRPLSEFQITKYFSKLNQYHYIFRSCGLGSKTSDWSWCCSCPKCLFVFIMLSAFLDMTYLTEIFGINLLEKKELLNTMNKLVGIEKDKPFECVGSRDEINTAICIAINKLKNNKQDIPFLYNEYLKSNLVKPDLTKYDKYYDKENNLPEYFDKIVRRKFNI